MRLMADIDNWLVAARRTEFGYSSVVIVVTCFSTSWRAGMATFIFSLFVDQTLLGERRGLIKQNTASGNFASGIYEIIEVIR